MYKADEIKVLDSLVVAVVSVSGIIFLAVICIISILSMSCCKCADKNCTACSRCRRTRDFYNGRNRSLFFCLKLQETNHSPLLPDLQFFCVFFCHLRSLVMMISISPADDSLSATAEWTCYSCFACCCVRCALQNSYLH